MRITFQDMKVLQPKLHHPRYKCPSEFFTLLLYKDRYQLKIYIYSVSKIEKWNKRIGLDMRETEYCLGCEYIFHHKYSLQLRLYFQ